MTSNELSKLLAFASLPERLDDDRCGMAVLRFKTPLSRCARLNASSALPLSRAANRRIGDPFWVVWLKLLRIVEEETRTLVISFGDCTRTEIRNHSKL